MIRTMQQYTKDQAQLEQFIPILCSANYVFAGPISGTGSKKGCLNCFLQSLNYNGSFYGGILESILEENAVFEMSHRAFQFVKTMEAKLEKYVIVVDQYTLEYELLPVHASPSCTCSGDENEEPIQDKIHWNYQFNPCKRKKSGKELFTKEVLDWLLNVHSGIGKKVVRDSDATVIPMYYVKSNVLTSQYYSYGRSMTNESARLSAIFEMIERYASIVPHQKGGLIGSYNQLVKEGKNLVSPQSLTLNKVSKKNPKGLNFFEYDEQESYYWTKVLDLYDQSSKYLPEQVVYYDSQLVHNEKRFIYETSNGCALGGTFEEAMIYALFEVIERDAFLMHWYNKIAPVQLNIEHIQNHEMKNIVRYMEHMGYEIKIFDITMESGVPAIWVAAIDGTHHGNVQCYNAAGAHLNPEKALEAALIEVVTSIGVYDKIIQNGSKDELLKRLKGHPEEVLEMEDHVYFYALKENYSYIENYYSNPKVVNFCERFHEWYERTEKEESLEEILRRITKDHKHIYVSYLDCDLTRELDLYCLKIIIPSMLTMTFGVENQRINYERISKGGVIAKLRECPISIEEINRNPHPFP